MCLSGEVVLGGWPILSINEWGSQQVRTLVLTSQALYRIAFEGKRGAIDHYSRTSLGSCRRIERGRVRIHDHGHVLVHACIPVCNHGSAHYKAHERLIRRASPPGAIPPCGLLRSTRSSFN